MMILVPMLSPMIVQQNAASKVRHVCVTTCRDLHRVARTLTRNTNTSVAVSVSTFVTLPERIRVDVRTNRLKRLSHMERGVRLSLTSDTLLGYHFTYLLPVRNRIAPQTGD